MLQLPELGVCVFAYETFGILQPNTDCFSFFIQFGKSKIDNGCSDTLTVYNKGVAYLSFEAFDPASLLYNL